MSTQTQAVMPKTTAPARLTNALRSMFGKSQPPTADQTKYGALVHAIDTRDHLQAEAAAVARELGRTKEQISVAARERLSREDALRGYRASPERHSQAIPQAEVAYREARDRLAELSSKRDQLDARLADLQGRIDGAPLVPSAQLVGNHQQAVAATLQRIEDLRRFRQEQEAFISQVEALPDPLAALRCQREDLLADIAMGDTPLEALDEIEAQISEAEATHGPELSERSELLRGRYAVLSGITRRLHEAEQEIERLHALTPKLLGGFLLAEIATANERYEQALEHTAGELSRVRALRWLLSETAPDTQAGPAPGFLVLHDRDGVLHAAARAAEVARLNALGIEIC